MTDMNNVTREVFGNIAPWMRVVFFIMIAASIASLVWQVVTHLRQWRKGQPGGFERDWRVWIQRLTIYALAQKRVHKKSLGALLHLLLFSGFVVLTIGTTLLAIAYDGPYYFHRGWYYLIYELTMDVFGVAFITGCLLAMYRRAFQRKPSLGHNRSDWWLLGLLLSLGITGFAVEALRMHYTQVQPWLAHWSIVGWPNVTATGALTSMETDVACAVQPLPSVTVTVYEPELDTRIDCVVAPVDQE